MVGGEERGEETMRGLREDSKEGEWLSKDGGRSSLKSLEGEGYRSEKQGDWEKNKGERAAPTRLPWAGVESACACLHCYVTLCAPLLGIHSWLLASELPP